MKHLGLALATAFAVTAPALQASAATQVYNVTIENLTAGQPFSPGVAVTHAPNVYLFRPGLRTNPGIKKLAKDGKPDSAISSLNSFRGRGVTDVVMVDKPIMVQGSGGSTSETFSISAKPGDRLSWARMLICTNDGIVGMDSVKLTGQAVTFTAKAYDAGAEINDERSSSLVDPCGGIGPVSLPKDGNNDDLPKDGGVTRLHANIQGVGDLGRAHQWNGPVARVTIVPASAGIASASFVNKATVASTTFAQPTQVAPSPIFIQPTQIAPSPTFVQPAQIAPSPTFVQPAQIAPSPTFVQPTQIAPSPTFVQPTQIAPSPTFVQPAPIAPAAVAPAPTFPAQSFPAPQRGGFGSFGGNIGS